MKIFFSLEKIFTFQFKLITIYQMKGRLKMRGGDAIIQALKDNGVDTICGYPGGTGIPFYDMWYD